MVFCFNTNCNDRPLTRPDRMKDLYFIVNAIKYKKLLDMHAVWLRIKRKTGGLGGGSGLGCDGGD